jgi:hypothetical protein
MHSIYTDDTLKYIDLHFGEEDLLQHFYASCSMITD